MKKFRIHPSGPNDLAAVREWLSSQASAPSKFQVGALKRMIEDDCLLLARSATGGKAGLLGLVGLDLHKKEISLLLVQQKPVTEALMTAAERLAVSYGMLDIDLQNPVIPRRSLAKLGYQPTPVPAGGWRKSLARRLTAEARKARQFSDELGIPNDYGCRHRLRLQAEPRQLSFIGLDVFGREQYMTPQAAKALHSMISAAAHEEVVVQVVSAFRSVDYQCGLVRKKLEKGLSMNEILEVSAAPGYSEHHSGRAVDLTTPDYDVLEESFANSAAFGWLSKHAPSFGFRLSYPRNNRHAVAYEPWHWYYSS